MKQAVFELRDLTTLEQVLAELPPGDVDRVLADAHSTALRMLRVKETRPPPGHASGDRLRTWIEEQTFQEGDTEHHCWVFPWTNSTTGYGEVYIPNKQGTYTPAPVHRLYWQLVYGADSIPSFHYLVHTCANKQCIRPDHMELERGQPERRRYGPRTPSADNRTTYEKARDAMRGLSEADLAAILAESDTTNTENLA